MPDAYEKARDHFVEKMAQIMEIYAMPPMVGRIYGLLAFTPRPVPLDEIAEKLGVAKSGVSTNLRLLEQMGFAEKVWVKGDRKDYWDIDLRMADMFYRFVRDAVSQEFQVDFKAVNECISLLAGDDIAPEHKEEAGLILKRLQVMSELGDEFYRIYDELLEELKTLRDKEEKMIDD